MLHTTQLPDGNRTADQRLAELGDEEGRVVVTKDRDFRDAHLLNRTPRRLLIVSTGNIANNELLSLFDAHLTAIVVLTARVIVDRRARDAEQRGDIRRGQKRLGQVDPVAGDRVRFDESHPRQTEAVPDLGVVRQKTSE